MDSMETIKSTNVDGVLKDINSRLDWSSVELGKQKVLIVEDDVTYEPFWKGVLQSVNPNISIDWVTSEKTAEEFLLIEYRRGSSYELVILDLLLAGSANGISLWTRFKEAGKYFLFVSELPIHRYIGGLHKEKIYPDCLVKPLDADECCKIVRQLLKNVHEVVRG